MSSLAVGKRHEGLYEEIYTALVVFWRLEGLGSGNLKALLAILEPFRSEASVASPWWSTIRFLLSSDFS